MSEFATSKINVIKPAPKWGWGKPNANPKSSSSVPQGGTSADKQEKGGKGWVVALVMVVLLAAVAVAGAYLLYFRKTVVPTPGKAATTTTVTDDFSGASLDSNKWTVLGTASQSGGKLNISIATGGTNPSAITYINQITGDFQADVQVDSVVGGEASLVFGSSAAVVKINRNETQVVSIYGSGASNTAALASGTGSVGLRILRVGDIIQTFYDSGAGFLLLGTYTSATTADGTLAVWFTKSSTTTGTAVLDNFTAGVNVSGAPTPVPGTTAACQVAFSVLDTVVATPTVTVTPTPGPTLPPGVTPTVTPTPTSTPLPTVTSTGTPPNACGGTCGSNSNCQDGMYCYQGVCRNTSCPLAANCVCEVAPTSTPVFLEKTGSTDGLWFTLVGGVLLVGAGGILLLAL